MRTIFISSFHTLISRNILSTPAIAELITCGVRVVLFVPENKRRFFQQEFAPRGFLIEIVPRSLSWQDDFLRHFSLAGLGTRSLALKRRAELGGSGLWLAPLIAGRSWFRPLLRALNRVLTPAGRFSGAIDRYRPDLVFATDVQNENDVRLMVEARQAGVPVVGMVRSWDNLTAKGLLRFIPDILLAHNEIVRDEAVRYHGVPPERIRVIGIPNYDHYFTEPRASRPEFFRRIGADPSKRLILFAPTGDRYLAENSVDLDILELLEEIAPADCQILVRFPPHDTVEFLDRNSPPSSRVFYDRPTSSLTENPRKVELTREMDQHLADTLYHSSLVVCGPSTVSIDAALFGKPVVLIGFDGRKERPYLASVRRYFDYEHQQPILASGGARLARSAGEFRDFVIRYLADPSLDREGRARIVREQCWRADGRASQRLLEVLLSCLGPLGKNDLSAAKPQPALRPER